MIIHQLPRGLQGLSLAAVLTAISLSLICLLLVWGMQVWVPRSDIQASDKLQVCAGLAVVTRRPSVWWSSPATSAVPPVAYASRYAWCGHALRPPFLVEQGSWPYPQTNFN